MAMATSITHMRGVLKDALNISPTLTPRPHPLRSRKRLGEQEPSVRQRRDQDEAQLELPGPDSYGVRPKLANPPRTTPPGNHTWELVELDRLVLGIKARHQRITGRFDEAVGHGDDQRPSEERPKAAGRDHDQGAR